jgi:hypothetical protein
MSARLLAVSLSQQNLLSAQMKWGLLAWLAVCLLLTLPANGSIILSDANSELVVSPTGGAGVSAWTVDGIDHLAKQWFWFRIGNTSEQGLHTMALNNVIESDVNGDGKKDSVTLTYVQSGLTVTLRLVLGGGEVGTYSSSLGESITIKNTSGQAIDLSFFQFADFDLNGSAGDQYVEISNYNTAVHSDAAGFTVSETVSTPAASRFQAGSASMLEGILNDGNVDNLDNTATAGPGNVAWAFQWDVTLANNGQLLISKNKSIVPEPMTAAMLGIGLVAGLARRRFWRM